MSGSYRTFILTEHIPGLSAIDILTSKLSPFSTSVGADSDTLPSAKTFMLRLSAAAMARITENNLFILYMRPPFGYFKQRRHSRARSFIFAYNGFSRAPSLKAWRYAPCLSRLNSIALEIIIAYSCRFCKPQGVIYEKLHNFY